MSSEKVPSEWGMWESFKPEDNIWYYWRLNGAAAYLKKNGDMWRICFKTVPFSELTDDFGGPEIESPPESLAITDVWGKGDEVFLHPFLSTMPYVLTFRDKIGIAPGEEVCFTAALPPLLKFELLPDIILGEAMPLIPRQTLFGPDTMRGKLGHSLSCALLPKQAPNTALEYKTSGLIWCDVIFRNSSKTTVAPEHFVLYPEPLNIYANQGSLFADTQEFEITGTERKLRITPIKNTGYRLVSQGMKSWVGDFFKNITEEII